MLFDGDTIVFKSTGENYRAEADLGKHWTFRALTDNEWAQIWAQWEKGGLKHIRIELCDGQGNILGSAFTRTLSHHPWHLGWLMNTNYVVFGWLP